MRTRNGLKLLSAVILTVGLSGQAAIARMDAPDARVATPDYADPALWLCRPGLAVNRCHVDVDATVIAADGSMTRERYAPARDAKVDCFFVYPTVSRDAGWVSDFDPDKTEFDDIRAQFARFGAACRQFAPMYRQGTLTALRRNAGGPQPVGEQPPADFGRYNDVLAAWRWYMAHENHGRGVVLIGHSQGTVMLTRLLAEEIDEKPVQRQLVSALLLGGLVTVRTGSDVGGSFKSVPLCHANDQTGCVIAYDTFRDTNPPPPTSRFAKGGDGLEAACTNPANLAGGAGQPDSYFLTQGSLNDAAGPTKPQWTTTPRPVDTFFVKTPDLVTTQCVTRGDRRYLALHVNPGPARGRTSTLQGDIVRPFGVDYDWGLHILDVNHSLGTLVTIVRQQARAYAAAHRN